MGLGVCKAVSLLTLGLEVDSGSFCVTGLFWLLCPFTVEWYRIFAYPLLTFWVSRMER